jgi:DNA replication regulator DPB11
VYAGQWNIKVVSLKWFTESLSRGMTLEETLYHPTTPEAEQGLGAWIRLSPSASLLGKRTRGAEPVVNPVRTKLRRTASAKLGSQNEGLWTDIVGGGFSIQPQAIKQWDDDDEAMKPPVRPKSMVLEPKSFASDTTVMEWTESIGTIKNQHTPPDSSAASKGFLHGRTFFIYGFTDRQVRLRSSM